MKYLSAYGFILVGQWNKSTTVKSGINYELTDLDSERVVYSFVVDGVPEYIGICEKDYTTLKDRMGRYKNQQGGSGISISTNKRISIHIKQLLDQGKRVEIYALKPAIKEIFVDLQVDLVKGLENPLIASFKPEWNR
ncbi:MAG: hypothetical protein A2X25_07535 [Chloroflexi bacterium GWB2_49_20]|nr:MAG: hypothetical protein A2X25_07535 [Chloroflexi bacterium GWB2_49_20]OGN78006.1 MAG: hypothetical protein A2X26_15340 [Chloroflexi bacterium GWC2_49_37]OGN85044.1 MAG: hypothetical protein A2X27_10040 [Chloroflexi bacterium GWD2_49_16]HBG74920.1 hypothetical protein [Anaerolineae bacterium]HCC78356.1 hypothetical protein [Anaerolineae bacterium]